MGLYYDESRLAVLAPEVERLGHTLPESPESEEFQQLVRTLAKTHPQLATALRGMVIDEEALAASRLVSEQEGRVRNAARLRELVQAKLYAFNANGERVLNKQVVLGVGLAAGLAVMAGIFFYQPSSGSARQVAQTSPEAQATPAAPPSNAETASTDPPASAPVGSGVPPVPPPPVPTAPDSGGGPVPPPPLPVPAPPVTPPSPVAPPPIDAQPVPVASAPALPEPPQLPLVASTVETAPAPEPLQLPASETAAVEDDPGIAVLQGKAGASPMPAPGPLVAYRLPEEQRKPLIVKPAAAPIETGIGVIRAKPPTEGTASGFTVISRNSEAPAQTPRPTTPPPAASTTALPPPPIAGLRSPVMAPPAPPSAAPVRPPSDPLAASPPVTAASPSAAAPGAAAPAPLPRYSLGQQLNATLETAILTAEGAQELPVYARTQDGTLWRGKARLDSTRRVVVVFDRAVRDGAEFPVQASAYMNDGTPGLVARYQDKAPTLVPDLLRSSLNGVKSYADAMLNRTTLVLSDNYAVEKREPPDFWTTIAGSAANVFQFPRARETFVTVASLDRGANFKIVYGDLGPASTSRR